MRQFSSHRQPSTVQLRVRADGDEHSDRLVSAVLVRFVNGFEKYPQITASAY
ncbi:MAG: hypothetical protein LBH68_06115 [Bifidobacteriaceae bacterium]|jgi:hypothetical protein|nr:hypothetical protein [Bifidobacteriaceae bacterium]